MSGVQLEEDKPMFSIVTITYNQQDWVDMAIQSVLSSSFTNFEYIIADDCSTDNTWQIINKYNDIRIKKYQNKTNLTEYPNRNKALSMACGKYLLFVDGDDILYKNSLRNLSEIIQAFPYAEMIWGVPDHYFYFAVLPYEFTSIQLINLLYRTLIPISVVGLSETVFKIQQLKKVGGFSNDYGIGDYYIRNKLATVSSVVFIPRGFEFWRQNINQATVQVSKGYRSYIERVSIDNIILPIIKVKLNKYEYNIIFKNIKVKNIKLLLSNTLIKGKILDFFKLIKQAKISIFDFRYLFKKGDYSYKLTQFKDRPLFNDFNF